MPPSLRKSSPSMWPQIRRRLASVSSLTSLSDWLSEASRRIVSLSTLAFCPPSGCGEVESEITSPFLPKLSPSKFVVGVPVTIHRRSMLSRRANVTRLDCMFAAMWPSSRTRRFQRTWCRDDTPGGVCEQVQFGTRENSSGGHAHCVDKRKRLMSFSLAPSLENPG